MLLYAVFCRLRKFTVIIQKAKSGNVNLRMSLFYRESLVRMLHLNSIIKICSKREKKPRIDRFRLGCHKVQFFICI